MDISSPSAPTSAIASPAPTSAFMLPVAQPSGPLVHTPASGAPQGSHPGVKCDRSGAYPIVGMRFHMIGQNYDLCQAEYDKLSAAEQGQYEAILPP